MLNLDYIKSRVVSVQYHVFTDSSLTVCAATLQNGYVVTGESACINPLDFNAEKGQEIALAKAIDKIWALEGYLAKDKVNA